MSTGDTKGLVAPGKSAKDLRTLLYFESVLYEISQLSVFCWYGRGIDYKTRLRLLADMGYIGNTFLVMYQHTFLL